MKEKGLPIEYWEEAVVILVYLINRCPTKELYEKIPLEARVRHRWAIE